MKGGISGPFAAPLVPAFIFAAWVWVTSDAEAAAIIFLVVAVFGYLSELLVGLPLLKWVVGRGRVAFPWVMVIGGFSPIPLLAVLSAFGPAPREATRLEGLLNLLMVAVPLGLVGGLTLWLLTYRPTKLRATPWA